MILCWWKKKLIHRRRINVQCRRFNVHRRRFNVHRRRINSCSGRSPQENGANPHFPRTFLYTKVISTFHYRPQPSETTLKSMVFRPHFPDSRSTHVGANHLTAWIRRCPDLREALQYKKCLIEDKYEKSNLSTPYMHIF